MIEAYKKLLRGEINRMPDGTYNKQENINALLRYLAFDVLGITAEQVLERIDTYKIKEYGLGGMLNVKKVRLITLLSRAFPEASWSNPVDLPLKRWTHPDYAKQSISPDLKAYFYIKCDGDIDRLPKIMDKGDMVIDRKLYLLQPWNGDFIDAIEFLYPGRFKTWQFVAMPSSHWREKSHRKEAVLWLYKRIGRTPMRGDYTRNNLYNLYFEHIVGQELRVLKSMLREE